MVGDNLVHFVIPMTSVPVLYVMLVRLGLVRDMSEEQHPRHRLGLVFFAMLVGLSIGARRHRSAARLPRLGGGRARRGPHRATASPWR